MADPRPPEADNFHFHTTLPRRLVPRTEPTVPRDPCTGSVHRSRKFVRPSTPQRLDKKLLRAHPPQNRRARFCHHRPTRMPSSDTDSTRHSLHTGQGTRLRADRDAPLVDDVNANGAPKTGSVDAVCHYCIRVSTTGLRPKTQADRSRASYVRASEAFGRVVRPRHAQRNLRVLDPRTQLAVSPAGVGLKEICDVGILLTLPSSMEL